MKCPDNRNYYQQGECEISAGASVVTCDSQIEFPEIDCLDQKQFGNVKVVENCQKPIQLLL